ncbi:MAG: hypothetical protein JO007_03605 [Alphaproteobacteria bacterium]|nr:hypothetical protein [Alphaproteobacteria bacterium]
MDFPGSLGANYTGRMLQPAPPVYEPQRVADVMVRVAIRPRLGAVVGGPAFLAKLAHAVAPPITEQMAAALLELCLWQADPAPVPIVIYSYPLP